MDSSDESFVWSRASTGSEDSDDEMGVKPVEVKEEPKKKVKEESKKKVKVEAVTVKQESDRDSPERYLERRAKSERRETATPSERQESAAPSEPAKRKRRETAAPSEPAKRERRETAAPSEPAKRERRETAAPSEPAKSEQRESAASSKPAKRERRETAASSDRKSQLSAKRDRRESRVASECKPHIEDYFSAGETVVESRPPAPAAANGRRSHRVSKRNSVRDIVTDSPSKPYTSKEYVSDSSSSSDSDRKEVEQKKVARKRKTTEVNSTGEHSKDNSQADSECSTTGANRKSRKSDGAAEGRKKSRISDRIQFEDDLEDRSEAEGAAGVSVNESASEPAGSSSRLRRYLRGAPMLVAVPAVAGPAPAASEQLWLLTAPSGLQLAALRGTALTVGERCRARTASPAARYEGELWPQPARLPLLTAAPPRPLIRNLSVLGTVHFSHKLPHTHMSQEDAPVNTTDFIPLPETKSRHPLLGADYKKALKLPKAVRKRLKAIKDGTVTRPKISKSEVATDVPDAEDPEETLNPSRFRPEPSKKKRKWHRESDSGASERPRESTGSAPKRPRESTGSAPKRPRPGSSVHQWDSVQDIEQNLFNY